MIIQKKLLILRFHFNKKKTVFLFLKVIINHKTTLNIYFYSDYGFISQNIEFRHFLQKTKIPNILSFRNSGYIYIQAQIRVDLDGDPQQQRFFTVRSQSFTIFSYCLPFHFRLNETKNVQCSLSFPCNSMCKINMSVCVAQTTKGRLLTMMNAPQLEICFLMAGNQIIQSE